MPTISALRYQNSNKFGSSPYGNSTVYEYPIVTNASGALIGSDSTAAIASGDVVRLGVLHAGFRLHDSLTIVSTAFTASVVGSIGFAYVDGVDSTDVPQDADYFGAAVALNTAGRYAASNTGVKPVTLPKDAWLTITTGGAANAKAADATVIVRGELVGIGE